MDIKVERFRPQEETRVFTITATDPYSIVKGSEYIKLLHKLKELSSGIQSSELSKTIKTRSEGVLHDLWFDAISDVVSQLRFNIENQLKAKFKPICEEIYAWVLENQSKDVRSMVSECENFRVSYKFDNDEDEDNSSGEDY